METVLIMNYRDFLTLYILHHNKKLLSQPGYHGINVAGEALRLHFNSTVPEVLDPAGNEKFTGEAAGGAAESYFLHIAGKYVMKPVIISTDIPPHSKNWWCGYSIRMSCPSQLP